MTRLGLATAGLAAILSAGCGCNSTDTTGGPRNATLETAVNTAGPSAKPINGDGDGFDPVSPPPPNDRPRDPVPAKLKKLFDEIHTAIERVAIEKARDWIDAERNANPEDALAWFATAVVRARLELRASENPDLEAVRMPIVEGRKRDTAEGYEWLALYCDGLVHRMEALVARLQKDDAKASKAAIAAEEAFRASVAKEPGFVLAITDLASLVAASGRLEVAKSYLQRATKLFPERYEVWHRLSMLYKREQNFLRALECLETAVAKRPDILLLRLERLGMRMQVWRELKDPRHEELIRSEFADIRKLAEKAWTDPDRRSGFLQDVKRQEDRFEGALAEMRLLDFEHLTQAEQTYEAIFARVKQVKDRRILVGGFALGLPRVKDPTKRIGFLLEILAKEEVTEVRIEAVRGLVQNPRTRRPWPEDLLAKVKPLVQAKLLPFAIDASLDPKLRKQV